MKIDFSPFRGGTQSAPRRYIDRRMRQLEIEPLDYSRRINRLGIGVVLSFVLIFVVYGLVAPISSAALASGEVSQRGDKLMVQPQTSGVVSRVFVREGQTVRAGQPLIWLDGVRMSAKLRQTEARYDALAATEARLLAQRDGSSNISFPTDLLARQAGPELRAILDAERATWRRESEIRRADRQMIEIRLASSRAQQRATERQLSLINDELTGYRELYDKGFARKTTVRALERTQAQLEAERATGAGAIAQAQAEHRRILDAQMLETVSQLAEVRSQLAQVSPDLAVTRYDSDQHVLRAQANGRVSGVVDLGPGMVVTSGSTLMEIVPDRRDLIVNARISPNDIDDVRVGQEATVRFSTVNPHGQTAFKGRVVSLSPDRVGDDATAHFRAQIALDDPAGARREGVTLQPGIPASISVKTKERTLFDYLFSPLTDAMSRSLREE
ncbi:HlyD family type I secretion periplasmic adaptor subunit [Sphingoaurantiacus capsulatus]|uniref:Membrane fusion protein (MFP) family protein n=1 Tax=Sphingoaurantiacus capsulatus TaxID=1771310 RepID=A0ABV7X757_9SPHN